MQEHRRLKRWRLIHKAALKQDGAHTSVECHIIDITLQGAQVALAMRFQKDVMLKMRIFLNEECFIDVEAWPAWHKVINDINVYGLYFTQIQDEDKDKIYQFIRSYTPGEIERALLRRLNLDGVEIPAKDQRVFSRFKIVFSVRYLEAMYFTEGKGSATDISAKGLGLVSDRMVQPGIPLELWLDVPDGADPLYTRGTVAWSKQQGEDEYRLGVDLEKADMVALSRVLRAV